MLTSVKANSLELFNTIKESFTTFEDKTDCGFTTVCKENGCVIEKEYLILPANKNTLAALEEQINFTCKEYKARINKTLKTSFKYQIKQKKLTKETGQNKAWINLLKTLVQVKRKNQTTHKTEIQYYVCNQKISSIQAEGLIRTHWHIENKYHLVLDKALLQDKNRKTKSPYTSNLIDCLCYNLLRNNQKTENFTDMIYKNALNIKNLLNYQGLIK